MIKLETFLFTRYGTIDAKVQTVTADAVNDGKRGAIFPVTLSLHRLSPGVNVSAGITKLGSGESSYAT